MSKSDGIGTWVWNDVLPESLFGSSPSYHVDFVSNGSTYNTISFDSGFIGSVQMSYGLNDSNWVMPYDTNDGGWSDVVALRTIDIKTAPPAEFLTILQPNATYQGGAEPSPSGTIITYNGATIATLSEGQTGTLACGGKKAVTDIAVVFAAAGSVGYNGKETAVEAGKTATLSCAGKKMVGDVVVKVGGSEPAGDELLGTWVFTDDPFVPDDIFLWPVKFTCAGATYANIYAGYIFDDGGMPGIVFNEGVESGYVLVWGEMNDYFGWADQKYRIITITDTSTLTNRDEFTTWLKANATKQS